MSILAVAFSFLPCPAFRSAHTYGEALDTSSGSHRPTDAVNARGTGKKPLFCGEDWDMLPACNTVTGSRVAESGCEAGARGHTYTMPCTYLDNMDTRDNFFPEDCLHGETAPSFVGRVSTLVPRGVVR